MKSVLHVLSKGHIGGAERAVFQLAGHQQRQGDRQVALGFAQASGPYAELARDSGLRIVDFHLSSGRDLLALARARKLFGQFDIHHFHVAEPVLMLASIASPGAQRVYTHRGGVTTYEGRRVWRYRAAGRLLARFDAVTGTAQAAAAAQLAFGICSREVAPTFNGLDFSLLEGSGGARDRLRAEHGVAPGTVIVGTAASLRAWKRIDWLIDAAAGLCAQDCVVWIVGDGPDRRRLEELAARSPAGDRVRFMGMQLDIADWLRCLDVFVLPSGPVESFGNAVVEAMACNLPAVVSADCPAHLQHVRDGSTGVVVRDADELAECLRELVADPQLRARLGAAATAFVRRNYTMTRAAESFEAVYRGLGQAARTRRAVC